ncbi:transmembrane protein 145-like [Bradysia coprophila]|uniref:transmembrane protein 145-like n=1 Tax=Bradysia coprophila TaxID=38358 RepID=UPI00187DCCA8|nr:transmembrane protein 145-like [Bradysia coprophila]
MVAGKKFIGIFIIGVCSLFAKVFSKYVEGHLKTLDNWAFVARFCFISGKGRYEYEIEFERRMGEPQLLLYYDDESQWPAVYKTDTTCQQKLSVLSEINNQIVTLSASSPHNLQSGCKLYSKNNNPKAPSDTSTEKPVQPPFDSTYFDQFIKTTTEPVTSPDPVNSTYDFGTEFFNNTDYNMTDTFNSSEFVKIPYSRDMTYENDLENGTEFINDVEELFTSTSRDDVNDNIRLPRDIGNRGTKKEKGTVMVICNNVGGFTSSRERWWYIAISNCRSTKGLDVRYRFRMTNGVFGDFWHEHFSADEMYIPPILLALSLIYSFLLIAVFICSIELKTLHLFHCTYRLFAFSVVLYLMGILLQGVAYAKYGLTGLGPNTTLGALFMGASEISFLTLVLLMAKGYTITRARLSSASTIKLTVFVNLYIVTYISLFIFQSQAFDPGEVLNLYESPAGFGLAGLRGIAWAAFIISIVKTIKKYPEKGSFYFPFAFFGTLWLLGGPSATFLGIAVLDPWVRESVMCAVSGALSVAGHSTFLYLTWPSRANKSFPYHVRANHVGIASNDDDGADYPRHMYEPALPDQNLIIPLSRRTEELIHGVYGQYLIERQINTIGSNYDRSQSAQDDDNASENSPDKYGPTNNTLYSANDVNGERQSRDAEQVDSGHPSLETSVSPNETTASSAQNTPRNTRKISTDTNDGVLKYNPFVVNGVKRAPNKVILEPIENSVKEMGMVPKHLFAAKKTK